jgi:nucleotide-binding universal stress UspA family protein
MKLIVAATDLSNRSERAVNRALRLAETTGAEVQIVTAVDDDVAPDLLDDRCALAETAIARQAERAPRTIRVTALALRGDPLIELPGHAAYRKADLVVLGLHRRRAILDMIRDTTMERLVRLLRTPVLLASDPVDGDYDRVLVPVSHSAACAAAVLTALDLAPKAKFTLLHAVHLPFVGLTGEGPDSPMAKSLVDEAERADRAWRRQYALPASLPPTLVMPGSLTEVVSRQIKRAPPDLLALGAHTRHGALPYTLGSFTAELIRQPPCDLLVCRPRPVVL